MQPEEKLNPLTVLLLEALNCLGIWTPQLLGPGMPVWQRRVLRREVPTQRLEQTKPCQRFALLADKRSERRLTLGNSLLPEVGMDQLKQWQLQLGHRRIVNQHVRPELGQAVLEGR